MVRPMTNWRPRMRIAWVTALRITGSPDFCTMLRRVPARSRTSSRRSFTTRPVSMSAQVEAFTNSESDWPRCASQSASAILSLISLSTVAASGTRSSASARHISTTPSRLDSSNSCRKASSPPRPTRSRRTAATSRRARSAMRSCASCGRLAASSRARTTAASSLRRWSRSARRRGSAAGAAVFAFRAEVSMAPVSRLPSLRWASRRDCPAESGAGQGKRRDGCSFSAPFNLGRPPRMDSPAKPH